MTEMFKRELLSFLIKLREERRRPIEADSIEKCVLAKAVDALEDLESISEGAKPWRCVST